MISRFANFLHSGSQQGIISILILFLFEKNYYTFIGIFGSNMGRSCIHLSQFFPSYIVIVQYLNFDLFFGTVCFYSSVSFRRMCRFVQPQSRQKTILSPKDLPHATHLQLYLPFSSTFQPLKFTVSYLHNFTI